MKNEKRQVLVRVPTDLYDKLVVAAAQESCKQGKTISVAKMLVLFSEKTLEKTKTSAIVKKVEAELN